MTKHEGEKGDGKRAEKSKLSEWVKKLSDDQLGALRDAVATELKDRKSDSKDDPHKMSDRDFENWKTRIFEESK